MFRLFIKFITLSLLIALAPAHTRAQEARQSVGLVLSGGGSKGIAHIGVIRALEDNDIPIDYITGTSMGAIVGGLYAAGYTTDEMMELILSRGFSYWSTGRIDPALTFYFNREAPSPVMFSLPVARKNPADSVPASLISPLQMNFAFVDLFAGYTAQCGGNFDKLFVPFRCVASDIDGRRKRVLGSGSLGDAIRASMSFPIVFQPISIDGTLLYDGGIYDNFPVDVMRETFAPSIMIGVTVNTPDRGPQTSIMDQLDNLVIQNNDYSLPADEGIKMHIDLHQFSLLDFPRAREIYKIGYDHAIAMIDSIKSRVVSRTPRETRELRRRVFKSRTPYVRFDSVSVSGGTPRQNDYLAYLFRPEADSDTIGIARARDAYYRAISSGKLRDLYPQATYNDSTGLFALDMRATAKSRLKAGFGGYITSSTGSYIYLSAGYSSLSFSSLDAGVSAWIGQSVMSGVLDGRVYMHTPVPSALGMQIVVTREKFYESDHLFYDDKTPTFIIDHEYFGRLSWSFATGRLGAVSIGAGYGAMRNSFFRDNRLPAYEAGRDRSDYDLGQVFARYSSSTLDDENFPTLGHSIAATVTCVMGRNHVVGSVDAVTRPKLLQAELRTRNYPAMGRHFTLGIETDVILSTRKLLPTYAASITGAPGFCPTPASNNAFRPEFRANSFVAASLVPVYRYNDNLSARIGAYGFVPLRRIEEVNNTDLPRYGRWLGSPEFFGEADISYRFPFASLTGYVNYSTASGAGWNVGISFGIYIHPPKFLRQ